MLLIVIAAIAVALVVQQTRAARREAELKARLNPVPVPGPKIMRLPYKMVR